MFGFLVYRRNAPLGISSVIGVAALVGCIVLGYNFPIFMSQTFWDVVVLVYILIASVTPVWILLQPRDYLNSFLLYGMMLLAIVGVIVAHPAMSLPAFTGWSGINHNSQLFPILFITVACGAISGFHSLVASGTTAKQLNTEKDAKSIGYGAMYCRCSSSKAEITSPSGKTDGFAGRAPRYTARYSRSPSSYRRWSSRLSG